MRLDAFGSNEEIYVDANIFIYVILKNPRYFSSCKSFLEKVERGEINAAISPLVIDEVCFKIVTETLRAKHNFNSVSDAIIGIKKNPKLLNDAKPELMTFLFIIENYRGLKMIPAHSMAGAKMIESIVNYNLLPRDALHFAIMEACGVKNIATNDFDFERVKEIKVWMP